jgi:hypothetical protein
LGIPRTTFCRWYIDIFSVAKLAWDQSPKPKRLEPHSMRSGGVNQAALKGDRTIAARVGGDVLNKESYFVKASTYPDY